MEVEFIGTPALKRALEYLFKCEAERHGARVERVVWNGHDADNHRCYDGERVGNASDRMAG